MGISRRRFLSFVGLALAGSSIDPLRAVIVHDDYYVNQDLGLGFIKPSSWIFESFRDFGYLIDKMVLSRFDDYTAASIKNEIFADPLVLICRYPFDCIPFNPSIQIGLENYDGMEKYDDYAGMIPETIDGYKSIFRDYELIEPVLETNISNCRAFQFRAKFLLELTEMKPTVTEIRTIIIFAERGIYTIHLQGSVEAGEVHDVLFDDFVQSLHIV